MADSASPDFAAAPRRVLAVDDDPSLLGLIETLLELAGYQVVTAANGRQALAAVEAGAPDFMILDMNMPVMDGFTVLSTLSARGALPPTLVLTARNAAADVRRAKSLGAVDYLAKPFSNKVLLSRVQALVAASRAA
ncbi:MAG: response regulator [Proteobacteria bacterium]|nr:response regulator [Pseudomonadota bacterium]